MHYVASMNLVKGGPGQASGLKLLADGATLIGQPTITSVEEAKFGDRFEKWAQKYVSGVGKAWVELSGATSRMVAAATAAGEPTWDVEIQIKGKTLATLIGQLVANLEISVTRTRAAKDDVDGALIALSAMFPSESLLTDVLRKSIVPKPNVPGLRKLIKDEIDHFVNLTWFNGITLRLEYVRNAWGHGVGELTPNGFELPTVRNGTTMVTLSKDDLARYSEAAVCVWAAYQLMGLTAEMLQVSSGP